MKKAMKKLMAVLLAVAMVCAMAIPAFAAEGGTTAGTGSITINGAIAGQTYKIYRILNLEANEGFTAYKYTSMMFGQTLLMNTLMYSLSKMALLPLPLPAIVPKFKPLQMPLVSMQRTTI